jgi:NhaP-type Na+/H+ or K+/H+ antiporter
VDPASYLAVVLGVGALVQVVAWHLRVPSILLLLVVGFGLGQFVDPEEVLGREVLFGGVSIAVGIILFEGSLSLRYRQFREVGRPVIRLCTLTPLVAWPLISLTGWLLGLPFQLALLVGAILIVTGPTVIAPILRMLRPTRRVASLLRWEGIVVDPIGAVLAVLVFQAVSAGSVDSAVTAVAMTLARTIAVSLVVALVLGLLLEVLTARHVIPDFLQGITYLAAAVVAMVASNAVVAESGLLTVTVLGIYLGNRPRLHLEHVAQFKEHLQVLLVGALFVVLAGRVTPEQVVDTLPRAVGFLAVLILVIRPLSIFVGLAGTSVRREEKVLLAGMAPRGIVAAAVVSIFSLEFAHAAEEATGAQADDLQRLADQAAQLVPLVFLVIVGTVTVYGLGVGRLAERLGLAAQRPQGVLFVGSQPWVVQAARLLEDNKVPALVVSREYRRLAAARMANLHTVTANILSTYAVKDMDLAGIGYLIAGTDQDEVNATAAREFAHVLGTSNTFQIQRNEPEDRSPDERRSSAPHLSARIAFQPPTDHAGLKALVEDGFTVKKTSLTEQFPLDAFRDRYPRAVIMFVMKGSRLDVVTASTQLPQHGASVLALVRDESGADDSVAAQTR